MIRLLLPAVLAALALSACQKSSTAAKAPSAPPAVPPPLPAVAEAEVPAPASLTVTLQPGDNLRAIGAKAYGHEKFSGFVARLNGIADPEKVAAGATLKTPALPVAFREAGLDPAYQPAINAMSKACTDFYAALPAYLEARKPSGLTRGNFAIPEQFRETFTRCADAIDAGTHVLEAAKEPHKVPRMTIDQFTQASAQLRFLARGGIEDYDYEMVGQRLGLAFTNALIWTQEGHK